MSTLDDVEMDIIRFFLKLNGHQNSLEFQRYAQDLSELFMCKASIGPTDKDVKNVKGKY